MIVKYIFIHGNNVWKHYLSDLNQIWLHCLFSEWIINENNKNIVKNVAVELYEMYE